MRPRAYLPPGMVGVEERVIAFSQSDTLKSHADGNIIDNSVDWRFRFFQVFGSANVQGANGSNDQLASDRRCDDPNPFANQCPHVSIATWFQMGQSFVDDSLNTLSSY